MICLIHLIEDELSDVFLNEAHSFQRFENLYENVLSNFDFLNLLQSGHITELGLKYPSGMYVIHLEMDNTQGHILASQVMPMQLLFLHFYTHPTSKVPRKHVRLAQERLHDYWNNN